MAHSLGELGGIVRLALLEASIPWVNINTSALKKFATGKGNVGKDEMIAHAIRDFGFLGSNNNEADAFLLWSMGQAALGRLGALNLKRKEAIAGVIWPWSASS
jgi:crossover junction endodeoxyribonuclease RuvC